MSLVRQIQYQCESVGHVPTRCVECGASIHPGWNKCDCFVACVATRSTLDQHDFYSQRCASSGCLGMVYSPITVRLFQPDAFPGPQVSVLYRVAQQTVFRPVLLALASTVSSGIEFVTLPNGDLLAALDSVLPLQTNSIDGSSEASIRIAFSLSADLPPAMSGMLLFRGGGTTPAHGCCRLPAFPGGHIAFSSAQMRLRHIRQH
jgi:hypothetical protein